MSLRQHNAGSIVKPGFNPLGAQTSTTTYYPYLYTWGQNSNGALGLGNTTYYSSPKQVGSLSNWGVISNTYGSFSVKNDGTLWAWGYNSYGTLGINSSTPRSSPTQVGTLTNWLTVAAGYTFCTAVKTDGTLWSWGYNNHGQLGFGPAGAYSFSSPKQVGSLTNWLKVANGYSFGYAIKTDGTLWGWGYNPYGNLGTGNTTQYSSPKQIGALTTWLQVAANAYYSGYAIKTNGTLWSWGYNLYGKLGLNNTTNYFSPVQVGALTNWANVSSNLGYSVVALKTDGTIWAWGYNGSGQLGQGNTTDYSSPKQIGSLATWSSISVGNAHTVALKTDGTAWSWGKNVYGELGLGNSTNYSSPKQIGVLTTWYRLSAGVQYTLAELY